MRRLLLWLALCLLAPPALAAPRYTVTDIGEGDYSLYDGGGSVISDRGQIVGEINHHAFLWNNGKLTPFLGAFATGWGDGEGQPDDAGSASQGASRANAVNNLGHVAGGTGGFQPLSMSGLYDCFPFLYTKGEMHNLSHLNEPRPYDSFEAFGINDNDEIVGVHAHHGFYWSRGKRIEFGTLHNRQTGTESFSKVNAINNKGQFVGMSTVPSPAAYPYYNTHAVLWSGPKHGGHWKDLEMPAGFDSSEAIAINDRGVIVGMAKAQHGRTQALMWRKGRMTLLPLLAGALLSTAQGVNNHGDIVGWNSRARDYAEGYSFYRIAVLWQNGKAIELNTLLPPGSGWTLHEARSINNHGWIVGTGTFHDRLHIFLLTPQP